MAGQFQETLLFFKKVPQHVMPNRIRHPVSLSRILIDRALAQALNILSSGIFICQIFFSFYEWYLFNAITF